MSLIWDWLGGSGWRRGARPNWRCKLPLWPTMTPPLPYCWLHVHTTEDNGQTDYTKREKDIWWCMLMHSNKNTTHLFEMFHKSFSFTKHKSFSYLHFCVQLYLKFWSSFCEGKSLWRRLFCVVAFIYSKSLFQGSIECNFLLWRKILSQSQCQCFLL